MCWDGGAIMCCYGDAIVCWEGSAMKCRGGGAIIAGMSFMDHVRVHRVGVQRGALRVSSET